MGIWKQRIDESWLKCTGSSGFRIINTLGGTEGSATAISLKHTKIDTTTPIVDRFLIFLVCSRHHYTIKRKTL